MESDNWIVQNLQNALDTWNEKLAEIWQIITQSPENFKGGGIWDVIVQINGALMAIGLALLVLFFVIGFCSESVDVREEMRFEVILRMLIRIGIAQWLVVYNVDIMKAIFTSVGNLVGLIGGSEATQVTIDPAQADIIKNLGFVESLVFLILAVFLSLIILICGFFLIYNVYFRFLKILVIVPFGSIAYATVAGNRGVSATSVQFTKYFISVVFEAVTMALAIILCNTFISSGLPQFTGDYADWTKTLIYLGEMTFTVALTVGSVKGAQSLTSKALGL